MKNIIIAFAIFMAIKASALTIVRDFVGGTPPTNSIGSGNITNVFNNACDIWESAIKDRHVLVLHYGWTNSGSGTHILKTQNGIPNRETEGFIYFNDSNNPNNESYWLDPTPLLNEEYDSYTEQSLNLGGGLMNTTRVIRGGPSDGPQMDLLTVALHEIGHALGMSMANNTFIAETIDKDVDVTAPRPFSGSVIPLQTNNYGVTSHVAYVSDRILMSGSFAPGERVMPSTLDIVALAQLCGFTNLNTTLTNVNLDIPVRLEISGPHMMISGPNKKRQVTYEMRLSWKKQIGNYNLQQSLDLTNWSLVSPEPTPTNGLCTVSVPMTNDKVFFRLVK